MNVAIVVLNWNGLEDTKRCVNSLLSQDYINSKIILIDNGSNKKEIKELEKFTSAAGDSLILIKNPKNLGFAGGVNTGIKYALENSFDAVALFNNDAIADKSWLSSLVSDLSDKKQIVTGLLLNKDGTKIDSTGDFYSVWGIGFPRSRGDSASSAPDSGYVFGATGGATLYKSTLFREIGLFDENFFAYYEDVDISFRAQLAGHKVWYEKNAVAYHDQGATSRKIPGFTVYHTFKNLLLLFWKNVPFGLLFNVGLRFLILYLLIFLSAVKKGSGWPALKGVFASIWYFWTSALWLRFKIQGDKKVSTSYIKSILYPDLPPDQAGMRKLFRRK